MVRIVKLTFTEEHADHFISIFENAKEQIRAAEGCLALQLIRDKADPCIFMTHSIWKGPEYLQLYRRSELFKEVWSNVRPLFAKEPEAWSLEVLTEL